MKTFYRVAHKDTKQGLWYNQDGIFTGLIHKKLNFCTNNELLMPYDREIVGWLSVTPTLEELFSWFPLPDIQRLQGHGFYIMKYEASDYKEYANHWVIDSKTSINKGVVYPNQLTTINN